MFSRVLAERANLRICSKNAARLIVYPTMWDRCPGRYSSTNIGRRAHLHARDTTLVVISPTRAELNAFRERMAWTIAFFSSYGSDFNYDFRVTARLCGGAVKTSKARRTG
jgi:predicted dithiol-disulfide oxidoreductase (DUF899 family)